MYHYNLGAVHGTKLRTMMPLVTTLYSKTHTPIFRRVHIQGSYARCFARNIVVVSIQTTMARVKYLSKAAV